MSSSRIKINLIVFICLSLTQSIGLLSYTFLRGTGKEDVVVPMVRPLLVILACIYTWIFIQVLDHSIYHWFFIWNDKIDFEKRGQEWNKMTRSSLHDWNRNLATIVQWSPYASEEDLLKQVSLVFFCFFQFYHKRRDAWIVECDNSFLLWGTRYSTNWFLILVRQKS